MGRALRGQNAIVIAAATALVLAVVVGLVVVSVANSVALAVIAAVTVALTVGAAVSLEIGIFALILVACTDGMLKGLSPGWHTQVLKDYFLVICLLRWSWLSLLGDRRLSVRHPIVPALLIFAAWCALQVFNSHTYSWMLALAGFRGWVIWSLLFFLAYDYLRTRRRLERLAVFIIVLLVPISIYGIVQYQIGYEHLYRLGPGFDVYRHSGYLTEAYELETRPAATMISPGNLGAGLSCALLMAIGAVLHFDTRRRAQLLAVAAVPLFATAMVLSGSRAALVGTVVGALALLLLSRRPRVALILAVVALVAATQSERITGGAIGERLSTIVTEREYTIRRVSAPWRTALGYASRHFLGTGVATGTGAGRLLSGTLRRTAPGAKKVPWAENDFGRALIELGVPGLLIFVWMLYTVVRAMMRAYRALQHPRDRWLVAGMFGACVGVLTRLLVGSPLYVWPESIFFWLFVAAVTKLPELARAEARAVAEQKERARDAAGDGATTGEPVPSLRTSATAPR